EDYADRQSFIHRALDDLGDAAEYLLKRWLMILALDLVGPMGPLVHEVVPFVPPVVLPPGLGIVPAVLDPLPFARVPETENHLLMINTSRYLTNQAMIEALDDEGGYPNEDEIQSQQDDTRDWLLERLQRIARNDFDEYNARPYQRYSINAVLN